MYSNMEKLQALLSHMYQHVRLPLLTSLSAVTALVLLAGAVQAQPVTVTVYHLEQLGNDLDVQSYGDFYARVTVNNGTPIDNFSQHLSFIEDPFVVPLYPSGELLNTPWALTRDVPSTLGAVPVRIEIFDDDAVTDNDRADINPDSAKEVVDLMVDLTTGQWSGDVTWPRNCVSGPNIPDSKSVTICFDVSVLSTSGDADGDGLLDSWEQLGYNADNDDTIDTNLPSLGANPLRKDIFVETDCLVAGNHTHCPREDAISKVVQSFANSPVDDNPDGTIGVQLHVDTGTLYGSGAVTLAGTGGVTGTYGNMNGGGSQIAEAGNEIILSFDAPQNTSGTNFFDLKNIFFDSRRSLIFRYGIFGHQTNPAFNCASGNATLPGRDFIVTLGGQRGSATGSACFTIDASGFSVGSTNEQAGAFMHELGHTLGLHHGGDQGNFNGKEINLKPNYLSVMNYAFWFCGLPASTARPDLLPGGCDYSRVKLPPLNEASLDECVGVGGGLLLGPMNWNGNKLNGVNIFEGNTCPAPENFNIIADINRDGVCVEPGNDGLLTSNPLGDDVTADNMIFDGQNRVCSSSAAMGDTQTTAVGQTPLQVNQLTGYQDWPSLNYSLLAIGLAGAGASTTITEPGVETIERSQQYVSDMLAPNVTVDKTGPATGRPGDLLAYSVKIQNQGSGPAVSAVLTDTAPDGTGQTSNIGVIKVGDVITQTSSFTVPADACPGDFTSASASVAFKDFVSKNLSATDTEPLQILDVQAPTLSVTMSPSTLFPSPNHKLELVTANITVEDNCDDNPTITLVSVTSNEPETGYIGSGDKGPDIEGADIGTDDRSFYLRSERATFKQSTGRVYTIIYRATDASGNVSVTSATVTVPRNNSSK